MNEVTPRPHPASENAMGIYAGKIFGYRSDIFEFMKDMWGLKPQPVKPEYQRDWDEICRSEGTAWNELKGTVNANWFGDYQGMDEDGVETWKWHEFEKGKHITWQQVLVLMAVNKSRHALVSSLISVVSGHGIGKSATCTWIILWYLYCFQRAQVPVTAPTATQMNDVLWKELSIWIKRMPDPVKAIYEWKSDYVRIKYDPEAWFARARTSTKENTEAIAGVHSDYVLIVVDEASGVPEQVFNTAEGALTSGNVIVIIISNGTRTMGYFYDSHHKNKDDWQNFAFDGEQTPMVDRRYVKLQLKRHGRGSEEFTIRVAGGFPKEEAMDETGYLQLIPRSRITVIPDQPDGETLWFGRIILGVDPSGEGKDTATIVARDLFKAKVIDEIQSTNENDIAQRVLTWATRLNVKGEDIVIDGFGIGTRIGQKIVKATNGRMNPYTALVGNIPKKEEEIQPEFFQRHEDEWMQSREELDEALVEMGDDPYNMKKVPDDLYLNIRALMYFRARKWLMANGQLVDNDGENSDFAEELMGIRYMRAIQGNKIQLMSKKQMLKLRIKSPNKADGLALTFLRHDTISTQTPEEVAEVVKQESNYDKHDVL